MKKTEQDFSCKKCEGGVIKVTAELTPSCVELNISKCDKCEYVYDLKELWAENKLNMDLF